MITQSKPAADKLAKLLNQQQQLHTYAVYRIKLGWIVR